MKKEGSFKDFLIRYTILIACGFFAIPFFYEIFRPLTIYPSYFLLNLFFEASLLENLIVIKTSLGLSVIEIINACIAGSAYYLFLILNLGTPNIKLKKRINMLIFSFLVFLIINILRIFLFSILFVFDFAFINFTHELFWYILSIAFVVGIWFYQVRIFNIKDVPLYSDLKNLYKKSIFNFAQAWSK